MDAKEIIKKYLDEENAGKLLAELNENKVYFAKEENIDIRYGKLKDEMSEKNKLYEEAQKHIAELTNGVKSSEELAAKQKEYEERIQALEEENKNIRIEGILKQSLLEAKATDIDYLTYRIKNKLGSENKKLELDENNKIKGLDEIIDAEKKSSARFFEHSETKKEVDVQELGKGKNAELEPKSLIEALQQRDKRLNNRSD